MPNSSLSDIFRFTELLNNFQRVDRFTYIPGTDKLENDVEHSYQLAILAWYIIEINFLNLNKDLVIKYALVHDLVEVYAGDTFLYSKDQKDHDTKKEREEEALLRIQKEFPKFESLHKTILDYENKIDEEARFVHVLDKIHPVLQNYLNDGRIWKEKETTLAMLIEKKKSKINLSPELAPIWNELEKLLIENEDKLFFKN